jgi:hypothetical protein
VIFFVLNLAIYYVLATIFSGTTAMHFKGRIAVISLATIFVTSGVSHFIAGWVGVIVGLVLGGVVSFLGLTRWLELTNRQALKITGFYAIYLVASSLLVAYLVQT